MSHMVPPEFWKWVIEQARKKNSDLIFIGEAYDNDPAKVPGAESAASGKPTNVMVDLLNAGFKRSTTTQPIVRSRKYTKARVGLTTLISGAIRSFSSAHCAMPRTTMRYAWQRNRNGAGTE